MSATNCINCGHGKDPGAIKCPFCGTTYLDLRGIDFDSEKPVVCEFVLPRYLFGGDRMVMSLLAKPKMNVISYEIEPTSFETVPWKHKTYTRSISMDISVSFTPLANESGHLFEITKEENVEDGLSKICE